MRLTPRRRLPPTPTRRPNSSTPDRHRACRASAPTSFLYRQGSDWCLSVPDPGGEKPGDRGVGCSSDATFKRFGVSGTVGSSYAGRDRTRTTCADVSAAPHGSMQMLEVADADSSRSRPSVAARRWRFMTPMAIPHRRVPFARAQDQRAPPRTAEQSAHDETARFGWQRLSRRPVPAAWRATSATPRCIVQRHRQRPRTPNTKATRRARADARGAAGATPSSRERSSARAGRNWPPGRGCRSVRSAATVGGQGICRRSSRSTD